MEAECNILLRISGTFLRAVSVVYEQDQWMGIIRFFLSLFNYPGWGRSKQSNKRETVHITSPHLWEPR